MSRPGGRRFSAAVDAAAADVRRDIDGHPFVLNLLSGTLPPEAFLRYLTQDAHYLAGYAVAIDACAARCDSDVDRTFWTAAARDTVEIEQWLHDRLLPDQPLAERSAACTAYVTFLLDIARQGTYPVLAAAVLPCFWVFSDLGRRLPDGLDLTAHPYAEWVGTYRDPRFAAATDSARAIVDALAADSAPEVRAAMRAAFLDACRYEWSLFDDAWTGAPGDRVNGTATTAATTNEASDADNQG